MFDLGFSELLLTLSIGLLILGPERLPGVVKTISYWVRKAKVSVEEAKSQISQELSVDEIEKNIGKYNEHFKEAKQTITKSADIDAVNESIGKAFSQAKKIGEAPASSSQSATKKAPSKKTKPAIKRESKASKEKKNKVGSGQKPIKKASTASKVNGKTTRSPAKRQAVKTTQAS